MIARTHPLDREESTDGIAGIREAFTAKNARRLVLGDAILQFMLEHWEPATVRKVQDHLYDTNVTDLLPDDFFLQTTLRDIAGETAGIGTEKKMVKIDPAVLPVAMERAQRRLQILRTLEHVRTAPDDIPPKSADDIAKSVRELAALCTGRDRLQGIHGRIPALKADDRVCALLALHDIFGRSPQLEALLSLLVSGSNTHLKSIAGAVRKLTNSSVPEERSKLFSETEKREIVQMEGARVRVDPLLDETLRWGITAIRSLIAALEKHLPKPAAPLMHLPKVQPVAVVAEPLAPVVVEPTEPVDLPPADPPPEVSSNGEHNGAEPRKRRRRFDNRDDSVPVNTADAHESSASVRKGFNHDTRYPTAKELGYRYVEEEKGDDTVNIRGPDGQWRVFYASQVFRKLPSEKPATPEVAEEPPSMSFEELEAWQGFPSTFGTVKEEPSSGTSQPAPVYSSESRGKSVIQYVVEHGGDVGYAPGGEAPFEPTDAPAGSPEKIEIFQQRLQQGLPLLHENDRRDYTGLTGAIRPREG